MKLSKKQVWVQTKFDLSSRLRSGLLASMDALKKVAEDLKYQIKDLEEQIDRADGYGLGLFHLTKKLHEKRKELHVVERTHKMPELAF